MGSGGAGLTNIPIVYAMQPCQPESWKTRLVAGGISAQIILYIHDKLNIICREKVLRPCLAPQIGLESLDWIIIIQSCVWCK